MEGDGLEEEENRLGPVGDDERLHLVEALVAHQDRDVREERIEVGVHEVVQAHRRRGGPQSQPGLDDHTDLALTGEQHLEQLAVAALEQRTR